VWRHAALVLAVCRRVFGHEQDAEGSFLVLARKAAAVRSWVAVGHWLACVALKARERNAGAAGPPSRADLRPASDPAGESERTTESSWAAWRG
jgi:hypothetical protein